MAPISSVGRPTCCVPSREGRIEQLGEAPRLVSAAVGSGQRSGRMVSWAVMEPGLLKGACAGHGPVGTTVGTAAVH